jgi:hypothetical protein
VCQEGRIPISNTAMIPAAGVPVVVEALLGTAGSKSLERLFSSSETSALFEGGAGNNGVRSVLGCCSTSAILDTAQL